MNFIEKIEKAIVEDKERLAIEKANLRAEIEAIVREALDRLLGVTDGFTIDGPVVRFKEEQVVLKAVIKIDNHCLVDAWQVEGICYQCKTACWSKECYTLAEIGTVHADFWSEEKHYKYCSSLKRS